MAELGDLSGLSASFLSLVENGKSDISMGRLARLLETLELTLGEFAEPQTMPAAEGGVAEGTEILYRRDHPVLESPTGIHTVVLMRSPEYGIQRTLITYNPGASVDIADYVGRRSGETFMLMISGQLVIGFRDGDEVLLRKGDCLVCPSGAVVRSRNDGKMRATVYGEYPGY